MHRSNALAYLSEVSGTKKNNLYHCVIQHDCTMLYNFVPGENTPAYLFKTHVVNLFASGKHSSLFFCRVRDKKVLFISIVNWHFYILLTVTNAYSSVFENISDINSFIALILTSTYAAINIFASGKHSSLFRINNRHKNENYLEY